jgi:hypothetical protein
MRKYPTKVDDLSLADVKSLTQVLQADPMDLQSRRIRRMISQLPCHLRNSTLINLISNSSIAAVLCSKHKDLNRQVIRHAFNLLQREVTVRLHPVEEFPQMVGPEEAMIIQYARGIQGMWIASPPPPPTSSSSSSSLRALSAAGLWWDFQTDKCEACILGRIGSNPRALRDLRTLLLSRNETVPSLTKTPAPRFLPFVQEWVNQHDDMKDYIYYQSGQQAYAMRGAREYAAAAANRRTLNQGRQVKKVRQEVSCCDPKDPAAAAAASRNERMLNLQHRGTATENKLHDKNGGGGGSSSSSRDNKSSGSNLSKPSSCSKRISTATDFENKIIDGYLTATPRVALTLEQQLGGMNLTPWGPEHTHDNDTAALFTSDKTTGAVGNTGSGQQDVLIVKDRKPNTNSRHGEFHIYPVHSQSPSASPGDKSQSNNSNQRDEYRILVTYDESLSDAASASTSDAEFIDGPPPTALRCRSPALTTWSYLYDATS